MDDMIKLVVEDECLTRAKFEDALLAAGMIVGVKSVTVEWPDSAGRNAHRFDLPTTRRGRARIIRQLKKAVNR
jgi:hypothetical protein